MQYIEQQKAKLKEKMDMAQHIETELQTAQEYLHERYVYSANAPTPVFVETDTMHVEP